MPILPDVLQPNLKVVFCGTAVSRRSAEVGAYYAGRGNRFWEMLHRSGLTPRKLAPHEFPAVLDYGVGLTDIVKENSGSDGGLKLTDFDPLGLRARIERFAPRFLAFNGKRAAQEFYGQTVSYGRQPERLGDTTVFVLPSTSGAARRVWDERCWLEFGEIIQSGL
jgi:TDG/mug DNA glycosylase family protein